MFDSCVFVHIYLVRRYGSSSKSGIFHSGRLVFDWILDCSPDVSRLSYDLRAFFFSRFLTLSPKRVGFGGLFIQYEIFLLMKWRKSKIMVSGVLWCVMFLSCCIIRKDYLVDLQFNSAFSLFLDFFSIEWVWKCLMCLCLNNSHHEWIFNEIKDYWFGILGF